MQILYSKDHINPKLDSRGLEPATGWQGVQASLTPALGGKRASSIDFLPDIALADVIAYCL
jgi:hypothetical protein